MHDPVVENETKKITFKDCIATCVNNREFTGNYDRLRNTRLSSLGGLEAMIDKATGKQHDDLGEFLYFIYEYVWMRLPNETKEEGDILCPVK